uniref:Uncharacterized protein n=1 Tax=Anguilla anguilla TaxID=7936 RepID=A0A0E9R819_ANGAN
MFSKHSVHSMAISAIKWQKNSIQLFMGFFQSPKTYIRHNHVIAYAEILNLPVLNSPLNAHNCFVFFY